MKYFVTVEGRTFEVDLTPDGPVIDGEPVSADLAHVEGTSVRSLLVDGRSERMVARRVDGKRAWSLHLRGRRFAAEAVDERTRTIREMTGVGAGAAGARSVRAPMPGLVVKVEVEEGSRVEPGQGVVIIEAMKMENELKAESGGVVSRVLVSAGEPVEKDQVLVELADHPAEGE
jgi:biotin carboxyl carrier protein